MPNLPDIGAALAILQNAAAAANAAAEAANAAAAAANEKATAANNAASTANAAAAACSAYEKEITNNRVALGLLATTTQAEMRDVQKRMVTAEAQLSALT